MPINIQRPITAADAFMEGATGTQNILSNILQGKQRQQELNQTGQYQQGMLGVHKGQLGIQQQQLGINQGHLDIARQVEQRAQDQMPYLIKKWEVENQTMMNDFQKKQLLNEITQDIYKRIRDKQQGIQPGGQQQMPQYNQNSHKMISGIPDYMKPGDAYVIPDPTQSTGMIDNALQGQPMQQNTPQELPQQTIPQPSLQKNAIGKNMTLPQIMQQMNNRIAPPAIQEIPSHQEFEQQAKQAQVKAQQSGKPQETGIAFDGGKIVSPAMNGMEDLDVLAATPGSGVAMRHPDEIKGEYPNQYLYRYWPSGLTTAHQTPRDMSGGKGGLAKNETSEMREEREVRTKKREVNQVEANKIINEVSDDVIYPAKQVVDVIKLLKDNPNLTGIVQGAKIATNQSESDAAAQFIEKTGMIQAATEKLVNQRGSNFALKWTKKVKPTEWKKNKFNIGLLEGLLGDFENKYEKDNKKYRIFADEDLADKELYFPGKEIEYPSMEHLQETAQETGMTVDEVKKAWREKVKKSRSK